LRKTSPDGEYLLCLPTQFLLQREGTEPSSTINTSTPQHRESAGKKTKEAGAIPREEKSGSKGKKGRLVSLKKPEKNNSDSMWSVPGFKTNLMTGLTARVGRGLLGAEENYRAGMPVLAGGANKKISGFGDGECKRADGCALAMRRGHGASST